MPKSMIDNGLAGQRDVDVSHNLPRSSACRKFWTTIKVSRFGRRSLLPLTVAEHATPGRLDRSDPPHGVIIPRTPGAAREARPEVDPASVSIAP